MGATYCRIVMVALVVVACAKADDSDDEKKELAKQMLRSMTEECMKQEGASEDDVEAMLEDKTPETKVQKCFLSCCQQQFNISDGKKFNKEGFLELCGMMFKEDDEKMKIAEEVGEECSTVENEDRCQLSVDIKKCVETGLEKRGVKM
ncbi:general odorant-binding protein 19d [Ochlerotatus camptorhynchus]|uniref:general odorant-binding protein 19d n=1 Tax=Ochlerotatus camptorhynchus TaxID=644619 RepID=UPI0031D0B360